MISIVIFLALYYTKGKTSKPFEKEEKSGVNIPVDKLVLGRTKKGVRKREKKKSYLDFLIIRIARYVRWLGYLDSNQGITVSETVVLPLDYIPRAKTSIEAFFVFVKQFLLFRLDFAKKSLSLSLLIVGFSGSDLHSPVDLFGS